MKHRDLDRRKQELQRSWKRLRARLGDTDTASQATQPEVQQSLPEKNNASGVMRPNTGDLPALAEEEQTDSPSHVVFVIVLLALIFIGIITYYVIQMPKKD